MGAGRSTFLAPQRWIRLVAGLTALACVGGIRIVGATSPEDAAAYIPTNPCRLADTRPGADNVGARATPLGPDEVFTLDGRGEHGACTGGAALPANATGLQLNVTAVNATQSTYLTVYPSGVERPRASHLNPTPGAPAVPNAVTVKLGADGRFGVYNRFGLVDVVVDVVGVYTDHHHDDRYYTRADVDARYYTRADADARYYTRADVDALVDEPWRVDVPMGSVVIQSDNPTVVNNRFLTGNGRTNYVYSFRLPDGFEPGTDLVVESMHAMLGGDDECGVVLEVSSVERFRDGAATVGLERGFVSPEPYGVPYRTVLVADQTSAHGGATVFRVGGDLAPGDWVRVTAARLGNDPVDTCPTITLIGVSASAA